MAVLVAAARGAAEVAKRTSASKNVQAAAEVVSSPKKTARRIVALGVTAVAAALVMMAALFGGAGAVHPSCGVESVVVFDSDLDRILATIRTLESGHNYTVVNPGNVDNEASGAYQFLRTSWANYGGYPEAYLAPPSVQDQKAAEWVTAILQEHNGDVAAVPVAWYIGHVPAPDSAAWDRVPHPGSGNTITPRQYQTKWLGIYADPAAHAAPSATPVDEDDGGGALPPSAGVCSGVVGEGDYRIPDGVTQLVASQISWGGYANGQIPLDAMRYSPTSNYMHPAASAAWDQLHAAAAAEGFDLRGNGYRPASAGGATAGSSNHGWGLAIDIQVLVIDSTHPAAVDAAFASDEYVWLVNNAPLYGFLNPAWAKPVSLGGNGNGGHVGDACCFLEPWHWEWAAFMNTVLPPTEQDQP